ncbi:MAG: NAD(P)-dependent oxidoreductase [Promethearchaeota archaeon]|nr:MAG: NAD(P)-dependent oxidoreductase [Candidatus Lokiarchaeota archaeon]
MKPKILLTGAFGNVGQRTLKELLKREYQVTCFELKNENNQELKEKLLENGEFKTIWGNITDKNDVNKAIKGKDYIIHLAAIIPPLSESNPELAEKVNVEGTRNLVDAAKELPVSPRFILASSIAVFGPTMHLEPPVTLDYPLNPSNTYSNTKVKAEKIVRESGLSWLILRLSSVSVEEIQLDFDPILYEVPLEQRIEFVASRDCGIAFTNAISLNDINRTFSIGGGEGCQLTEREFLKGFFDAFGLPMLPDKAFKKPTGKDDWYNIDWIDTTESQKALNYQNETFEEYIERIKKKFRWRRLAIKMISPIVKYTLVRKSPYS